MPRWRTVWKTGLVAFDMASRGLTQTTLAAQAGVTQVTVSRLLRGKSISVTQVKAIAEALGHTVDRYVEDVVWEPESAGTDLVLAGSDNRCSDND